MFTLLENVYASKKINLGSFTHVEIHHSLDSPSSQNFLETFSHS